jgi:uncharacterized membrane protein YeiH
MNGIEALWGQLVHFVTALPNTHGWVLSGHYTTVDLIAASTNALNGALLARRPDHFKNYTVVGILLMALLGGIGGGATRDIIANELPSSFMNPAYIFLCLAFGLVGYFIAYKSGQLFREGLFQFMTSFSLPWYAIAGAMKGVSVGFPVVGILLLAVIGPTAGRYYIDITSGKPPKQFVQGEWFVGTAVLTAAVWLAASAAGLTGWWAIGLAFVVGAWSPRIAGGKSPCPKSPRVRTYTPPAMCRSAASFTASRSAS